MFTKSIPISGSLSTSIQVMNNFCYIPAHISNNTLFWRAQSPHSTKHIQFHGNSTIQIATQIPHRRGCGCDLKHTNHYTHLKKKLAKLEQSRWRSLLLCPSRTVGAISRTSVDVEIRHVRRKTIRHSICSPYGIYIYIYSKVYICTTRIIPKAYLYLLIAHGRGHAQRARDDSPQIYRHESHYTQRHFKCTKTNTQHKYTTT